jgi:hypothetical protein
MTTNADAFVFNDLSRHYQREKEQRGEPQMLLVASDGELYGHHQPFRDKFLAYLLSGASSHVGITPTFPAHWLKSHPPRRTIGIRDLTSWSCHHGVVRWMGDCSCTPSAGDWKLALRRGLDQIGAALETVYVEALRPVIADPWALRNRYIDVILGSVDAETLIHEMAGRRLEAETSRRIHLLLEAQRERQRMYTSCGWFFDDFDRIEPKNNVAYAAHALALTRSATGVDLVPSALSKLQGAVSWRTGLRADQVLTQHLERERSH